MFPGFVTTFIKENKLHLYYFPGIDDDGRQIYRNIDFADIKADYKYVKNSDKSIEFIFNISDLHHLSCNLVNNKTGETKLFKFI